jgi:hypothetical protein
MSLKLVPAVAVCAGGTAIALATSASARNPNECTTVGTAADCNPNVPTPPDNGTGGRGPSGANSQNGAYGPSGDAPPARGNN